MSEKFDPSNFELKEIIGSGAQAWCEEATYEGHQYCLKFMPPSEAEREIAAFEKCGECPYLIRLHCVLPPVNRMNPITGKTMEVTPLVLEYADGGDIHSILQRIGAFRTPSGDERLVRTFFKQLIDGLKHMHDRGICHRDIKPENCVVIDSTLKVIDLGHATPLTNCTGVAGTDNYMAPEVSASKYDGTKADIYSAVITLFMMLTGIPPYSKNRSDPVGFWYYCQVLSNRFERFFEAHERFNHISEEAKILLKGMMQPNPNERFTMKQIEENSWFMGETCTTEECAKIMEDCAAAKKAKDDVHAVAVDASKP